MRAIAEGLVPRLTAPAQTRCRDTRHDAARAPQQIMDTDRPARRLNQARLRELRQSNTDAIRMFCSHDRSELQALKDSPSF